MIALAFSGCLPTPRNAPVQQKILQSTQANTEVIPSSTDEPTTLELGQRFSIGQAEDSERHVPARRKAGGNCLGQRRFTP